MPQYIEFLGGKLEEQFTEIYRQFKVQIDEKVKVRESNLTAMSSSDLFTDLPQDIFKFMQDSFQIVDRVLTNQQLFEFIKNVLMERYHWILGHITGQLAERIIRSVPGLKSDQDTAEAFESLFVILNDTITIYNMYDGDFMPVILGAVEARVKEQANREEEVERANQILIEGFTRTNQEYKRGMIQKLGRFIVATDIEQRALFPLFTVKWEEVNSFFGSAL